jgi:hypothetical protein
MKKIIYLTPVLFLLLASTAFARSHGRRKPSPSPVPTPTPTSTPVTSGITLGAFNANVGTVKVSFLGWKDTPPRCVPGKTTLLYWENPTTSYDAIANGSQDSVIKNFAAKVCPGTILSVFHEMNLNESPWFGVSERNHGFPTRSRSDRK